MLADVSLLDLRLRRRLLIGYTLGFALYALVIVVLYPEFKNTTSLNNLTKHGSAAAALFGVTGSLTSPSGWLNANLYQNFLPLIMLLITIGYGASCLAGQDEDGTLSLVTTLPISRRNILVQKVATLALQAVVLAFVTMLCMVVGRGFDLTLPVANLAGVSVGVALLGIDFGLLAIAVGSWTGSRGMALGITASIAAASFLLSCTCPGRCLDTTGEVCLPLLLVNRQWPAGWRTEPCVRCGAPRRWCDSACRLHLGIPPPRSSLSSPTVPRSLGECGGPLAVGSLIAEQPLLDVMWTRPRTPAGSSRPVRREGSRPACCHGFR